MAPVKYWVIISLFRFLEVTKKATSTVSTEIHKGAIFDSLKIRHFMTQFLVFAKIAVHIQADSRSPLVRNPPTSQNRTYENW
jgi:hypothetical protein